MTTKSEDNIFTRFDMYNIMIKDSPKYRGGHDYYSLERFLAIIHNCDCTDCGGNDVSRKCAVEQKFAQKHGSIIQVCML